MERGRSVGGTDVRVILVILAVLCRSKALPVERGGRVDRVRRGGRNGVGRVQDAHAIAVVVHGRRREGGSTGIGHGTSRAVLGVRPKHVVGRDHITFTGMGCIGITPMMGDLGVPDRCTGVGGVGIGASNRSSPPSPVRLAVTVRMRYIRW